MGYPSYAAYVVDDEMARTTGAVYELLDGIWTPALERAKGELAEMEELFRKDCPDGEFAASDWWYYAEKLRRQKYALDESMLRPYFSLENVRAASSSWPTGSTALPSGRWSFRSITPM